ncbi:M28 family metallopeptidase [Ornithinimicrobium cerasi]|uniref:Zn-dependent amino- or carboxypeptidase, M28 family n=1 Tax=Ornithinimicrobium cerasi TaxID=2248773 RepID=A0A285VLZ8_9MICO|nr:M28 family metallopeptidase [Ornithinimicrobium cerasi]SOC55110.1 Zn-dependent amino- or carboxypeptidase, M28 family [Ornithinimicrobium cerasi]
MISSPRFRRTMGTAAAAALVGSALVAAPSGAAPAQKGCDGRTNNTYDKLLECVRLEGVVEHMEEFQAIADANGGNRADQTPGYQASVDYVVEVLEGAGWSAEVVPFTYDAADVILRQITPVAADYIAFDAAGTGEGDVTGTVIPVDINLDGDRANSSGCEPEDFAGLDFTGPDDIALMQRGTCSFGQKAANAQAAGAEAVVLFNQGDASAGDRFGPLNPTLLPVFPDAEIPVVGTTFAAGEALAQEGSTAQVKVDFFVAESFNVIGELAGKTDGNVVMAGAHLDSVPAGPGINDNGSGSAALLEVAQQMSKSKPQNTVRFAWWGAEELGLIGSTEWVEQRTQAELDEIALYLNFDMIGSPNYYFGVYDADESSFVAPVPVPEGSEDIEQTFEEFYTLRGEPYDDSAFSGRSDYQAFINNGIPSGGLFTGAEVVKTAEQQSIWGGTAGQQFDPCYHLACDTIDNYSPHALEVNSDAVAFAVFTYAASTESVNGVAGAKIPGNFRIPAPAGPEHTFAGPLGGDDHGHDHDHHESE